VATVLELGDGKGFRVVGGNFGFFFKSSEIGPTSESSQALNPSYNLRQIT
jgi:hypothetical protein